MQFYLCHSAPSLLISYALYFSPLFNSGGQLIKLLSLVCIIIIYFWAEVGDERMIKVVSLGFLEAEKHALSSILFLIAFPLIIDSSRIPRKNIPISI
jgi:hypothetical protein